MTEPYASRCKVAIVGFGQSDVYRHAPVPLAALTIDACRKAIADAGLTIDQIDGLATYPTLPTTAPHGNEDGRDVVTTEFIAQYMGISPRWKVDYQGGGQIGSALIHAVNAIAAGAAEHVLLFRGLYNPTGGRYHGFRSALAEGTRQWTAPYGLAGPPAIVGFAYREYMERYGATHEEMATLVCTIRKNAETNPLAYWYGKPLSREDYLNGRMIGDPIRLFDCDIPIDGAGAFVLTSAERARDLPHLPVYVAGFVQTQSAKPRRESMETLDGYMEPALIAGERLWAHAGVSPAEIDCPQLYDGFSQLTYFWLEALRFCGVGEAHSFVQDGRIDATGPFPLLSGGGNIGNGRLHGIGQIRENYLQLSRRAGERQLAHATVGVSSHSLPPHGSAIVYTAEKLS